MPISLLKQGSSTTKVVEKPKPKPKVAREEILSVKIESTSETDLKPIVQDRSRVSEIVSDAVRQDQKATSSQILSKPRQVLVDERFSESTVESNIEPVVESVSQISNVIGENVKQDQRISSSRVLAKPVETFVEEKAESTVETNEELAKSVPQVTEVSDGHMARDQKITSKQVLVKPKVDALDDLNESVSEVRIEQ